MEKINICFTELIDLLIAGGEVNRKMKVVARMVVGRLTGVESPWVSWQKCAVVEFSSGIYAFLFCVGAVRKPAGRSDRKRDVRGEKKRDRYLSAAGNLT